VKVQSELPPEATFVLFGFHSVFPLTVLILAFNFSVLAALFLTLFAVGRREYSARRLRYKVGGLEVIAPPIKLFQFHAFLSHLWGTGQDQARIIKHRLIEMVLGLRVFLE
jgi:hypothetical protein